MSTLEQDIVAVGLNLEPDTLIHAYSNGVFPWPTPGYPMLWYCPRKRAILDFKKLHINKRLHQYLKKENWVYTINQDFAAVIENCSKRKDEEGTWITKEMKSAYTKLHDLKKTHSFEVRSPSNELEGGLYGVDVKGSFAGESMFHLKDNASKAAILFTIHILKKLHRSWMDIQVMTPHMEAFGAEEITRSRFLKKLEEAQSHEHANIKHISNGKWKYDPSKPGNFIEF